MSIDRRKFLAIAGIAGGVLAGGVAVTRQVERDPSAPGNSSGDDDPDAARPTPADGGALHIPSATEHVVTGREGPYRELRWETQGTLVIEPDASIAFADTRHS